MGALIWWTLSYLSCAVPGASWAQHVPGDSRGIQWQRSYSSLMVCISGFSACIWAGFSACICLAVVGAIEDVLPQTHQDFGYNHATTMDGNARGGAKQSHCCYCRRGDHILEQKLKASTPARLLYHPKYVWPLQTDVKAASHHPGFMCHPRRGNFLPCSPS